MLFHMYRYRATKCSLAAIIISYKYICAICNVTVLYNDLLVVVMNIFYRWVCTLNVFDYQYKCRDYLHKNITIYILLSFTIILTSLPSLKPLLASWTAAATCWFLSWLSLLSGFLSRVTMRVAEDFLPAASPLAESLFSPGKPGCKILMCYKWKEYQLIF